MGTSKNSQEFQRLLGLSFWFLAKVKYKGFLEFVHLRKKEEELRCGRGGIYGLYFLGQQERGHVSTLTKNISRSIWGIMIGKMSSANLNIKAFLSVVEAFYRKQNVKHRSIIEPLLQSRRDGSICSYRVRIPD